MLNTSSIKAVDGSVFSQRFIKPRYDSYCFSNIPAAIAWLLTGNGQSTLPLDVFGDLPTRYDQVILLFLDAFGWRFFERHLERAPLLKAIARQGVISKLTSQFPSTTAAHATCIHTGLEVGQSGIYEWHYYEPLVNEIISPLLFSYARDGLVSDTLAHSGISPAAFFPQHTLYHSLAAQGVTSHVFQWVKHTASTYTNQVCAGALLHPYQTLQEALVELEEYITAPSRSTPAYYLLYFDRIDATCHKYGPTAQPFEEAVEQYLSLIDQFLYQRLLGKAGNTLLIITADHGQVTVNPATTSYLNLQLPAFSRYLKTNAQGVPLVPAGSARDMFLYVKEELIDEGIALLRAHLTGKAEVYRTQELLEQHFFGQHAPSPAILARLGNVVILPYQGETVWWFEEGLFRMPFNGHHGGLTPEEMEIPLLMCPLG